MTRAFALIPATQLLNWRPAGHAAAAPAGPRLPSLPHEHAETRFSTPLLFGDVFRERCVHNAACVAALPTPPRAVTIADEDT